MAVCLRGRRAGRIVLAYLALVMTHEPELKHIKRQITHNAAATPSIQPLLALSQQSLALRRAICILAQLLL